MARLKRTIRRLAGSVWPSRAETSVDREIASHLQLMEDDYRRRGLDADHARRAARLALGGVDQTKERHRDARMFRSLDDARRDVVYAGRMLRRHPIAAIATTLSLALGLGLNTAIFSVVDWVLLRSLPYPSPEQLVRVFTAGTTPVTGPGPLVHGEFVTFGASNAFERSAAFTTATRVIRAPNIDPIHVVVARVAGDLFATLRVSPAIGRSFSKEELTSGLPVVILSHDLWRRSFAEDPAVLGRSISIDGAPNTVIGVMAAGRGYPGGVDAWRPLTASEREDDDRELNMVARLREGATVTGATSEVAALAQSSSNGARTAWADALQRTDVGNVSAALQVLFAAAMLTLVIACANVAALVGARGADRAGEMAVRGALGATRARVMGQLLIESMVLAGIGGAVGLVVGHWALGLLVTMAPVNIPRLAEVSLDTRVLGAGIAATMATGLSIGIIPALRLSRFTGGSGINPLSWQRTTPPATTRGVLVLVQVVLAIVLTAGAGLLTRSLRHLVTIDHGFAPDRLVAVDLYLRGGFDGDARQLIRELIAASESIPGVESAAWAMQAPSYVAGLRTKVQAEGLPEITTTATLRPVSQTYFAVTGIRLAAGRPFTSMDTSRAASVAIVNETFARDLLGGRSPIGVRLTPSLVGKQMSIVGVVGDVTPAGEADRPALYVPVEQLSVAGGHLIVRARGDAAAIMPALASRIRSIAPGLPMDRMGRVAARLEDSRAMVRFSTQLAGGFAALALLLSVVGVYGLAAGDVAARWREIAVRLALGASRVEVLWTVLRRCAALLTLGAILGVVCAIGVGPALASQLRGVSATDALTLAVAPLLLCAIGIAAAALAASRVLSADPAATLRGE